MPDATGPLGSGCLRAIGFHWPKPVFTRLGLARNIGCVFVYLIRLVLLLIAVSSGLLCLAAAGGAADHLEILNVPFPLRHWPYYSLSCLLGIGAWLFSLRRADWNAIVQPKQWSSRLRERHAVTALVLLKILLAVWICHRGYLFLSSDDFCRIDVAYRWREQPFFATWDHVWLAGQFYVQGSFIWLLRDPMMSVRLSSLLFSVFYALVFYRLAREVFDRRTAGVSLALVAVLPYPTWLSVAGHPNPFFMAFALLGVLFLVTGRGRWGWLVGAAVCFGAASAFRYEGLLLGVVFAVWNVGLAVFDRRRWTAKAITAHVVLILIPFVYIMAWSISCYQEFGDAFRYLRTLEEFAPKGIAKQGTLGRMLWYPRVLGGATFDPDVENHMSPVIFFLGLVGIPVALMRSKERGVVARYTFIVVFNFGLLVWTAVRGGGNVMAQRIVILSQIFLIPFVAAFFFEAWDRCRAGGARWISPKVAPGLRVALVCGATVLFVAELAKTVRFPMRMRGVDPDTVALGQAVHRRFLEHRPDPAKTTAILIDGHVPPEGFWVLGTLGRHFEKTMFLLKHWEGKLRPALERRGLFLYIARQGRLPEGLDGDPIESAGKYHLWQMTNPVPAAVLDQLRIQS